MLLQDINAPANDDIETIAESLPIRNPRSTPMRTIIANIAAPVLMLVTVSLAWAYPSASDFIAAMNAPSIVGSNPVGDPNVRRIVTDIAESLPASIDRAVAGNNDCFDDPAFANAEKRARCGRVVYTALIALDAAAKNNTLTAENGGTDLRQTIERLKYVATEVCRTQWASGNTSSSIASPACGVSNIDIALAAK